MAHAKPAMYTFPFEYVTAWASEIPVPCRSTALKSAQTQERAHAGLSGCTWSTPAQIPLARAHLSNSAMIATGRMASSKEKLIEGSIAGSVAKRPYLSG